MSFGEALDAAERSEYRKARKASAVTVPRPALSPGVPPARPHPHEWTGGPRHGSQLRSPYRERTIDMLIASDDAYCRAPVCKLGRSFGRAETLADLRGLPLQGTSTGCRFDVWTVDHVDGDNSAHWFDNERLTHWSCNNRADKQHRPKSQRHSSRPEREGERRANPPPLAPASSMETQVHTPIRAAWDAWIVTASPWKRLRENDCLTMVTQLGTWFLADDLASLAENDVVDPVYGKATAQTFGKMIKADRFGVLQMMKDKGRWWVKLRGKEAPI